MKLIRRHWLACTAAALALAFSGVTAAAYPDRPVTIIVPWGAGGGTDAVARFVGAELEKELKQPVNVVNRTGGSGVVGHQAIAVGRARRLHARADHGRDHDDATCSA